MSTAARTPMIDPAEIVSALRIIERPASLRVVPRELLESLAASAPAEPSPQRNRKRYTGGAFDLDVWIAAHCPEAIGPTDWRGGRK